MTRAALNLVRPLAQTLPEQAPIQPGTIDWRQIEQHTCSIIELAAVWRISEPAACNRVARGADGCRTLQVPSRKRADTVETRVTLRSLPKSTQRAIRRLRRSAESDARAVAEHPGGEVLRDDDGRLALMLSEREIVKGLYLKRYEPGPGHLLHILARDCIRCHAAPMRQLVPGARARYGQWRCSNADCGLEFSYSTIRRICSDEILPEAKTLARNGLNAWVNKHDVYRPQPAQNFHRNERVYGDHHELDLWAWDERDPARKLRRGLWFSYWGDKATGVGEWRMAWRANTELLMLAFRAYVKRWGLPEEAWTDWGRDYRSHRSKAFVEALGVEAHRSLPSKRAGESHGKSKPVERFFGTLERDVIRPLPGWCGTHPKERPDDVLWPQQKQHEAFAARTRADTPFLSCQQIEKIVRAWMEQHFLITPSATADAAPNDAFMADSQPVKTWGTGKLSERAFDVLLMPAKTRLVGRNGVSVDGRMYWSEYFAGLTGLPCTVRWDPGELGQVIVSVHQKGKADQIIIATSEAWQDLAESNFERFREIKKDRRRVVREGVEQRHLAAAGITPYHQMLLEAQAAAEASAEPTRAIVNGSPVITSGHHLARNIEKAAGAPLKLALSGKVEGVGAPVPSPSSAGVGKPRKPVCLGDSTPRPLKLLPEPSVPATSKPIFTSAWEKEQWEREQEVSVESDGTVETD